MERARSEVDVCLAQETRRRFLANHPARHSRSGYQGRRHRLNLRMTFASQSRELPQGPIIPRVGITLSSLRPSRHSYNFPSQKARAMGSENRSETVTKLDSLIITPTPEQNAALKVVRARLRLLRLVVERVPHHFDAG